MVFEAVLSPSVFQTTTSLLRYCHCEWFCHGWEADEGEGHGTLVSALYREGAGLFAVLSDNKMYHQGAPVRGAESGSTPCIVPSLQVQDVGQETGTEGRQVVRVWWLFLLTSELEERL